ncbi:MULTISPECIES: antitoxin [Streptomyces]|uniref:Antitoxin n=1 Tax=Streptomyces cacaoi TaxID=1898 RepID=A0A4Y3QX55_STRCI|nr:MULTISPECIES: antitoxin [Streptomyces]NNG85150.1 antitoxin [Streptomyces cacaoi]QHF96629.1 antitoxin [Streptomyces sp. NHF165]GEB49965.1 hypothetical protein SCA03_25160 [Streptomyces cacaoi]
MGFMDSVKNMLSKHGDKVQKGLDKAAQTADDRTKGKYSDKIKSGTQKAKEAAEKYADDQRGGGSGRGGSEGPGKQGGGSEGPGGSGSGS